MSDRKPKSRLNAAPPEKFYSTGEVMAHTGLSRQTLHNYKRLGLITPAKWTPSGHCFYDESVFDTLRRIKLLQRHRSLMEIKAAFEAEERGETVDPVSPAVRSDGAESAAEIDTNESDDESGKAGELLAPPPRADGLRLTSAKSTALNNADSENRHAAPTPSEFARGLITGENTPPRLYRIGDIMRLTGYSRQTLHNYTVQGLIQARERTAAGHRLYGEDVFRTLRLIEIFKRHRRFSEVQKLIDQWRELGHTQPGSGFFDSDDDQPSDLDEADLK